MVRIPSVFACGLAILILKSALTLVGYETTLRWIGRHVRTASCLTDVDSELVNAAEHAVAIAAALYPGRARCLEQSLVLYYLLRRQGVAVRYRQGVQAYPFEAHAWIEYRGQPINDVAEHVGWYTPLPDSLP
jgi:hypothetical protein